MFTVKIKTYKTKTGKTALLDTEEIFDAKRIIRSHLPIYGGGEGIHFYFETDDTRYIRVSDVGYYRDIEIRNSQGIMIQRHSI